MISEIYNLNEKPFDFQNGSTIKQICVFDDNDFVMCTDAKTGTVLSAGYSIESKFLNDGNIMAPIATINNDIDNHNGNITNDFSAIYHNLAIPAGLSYINYPNRRGQDPDLSNELYTFKEPLSDDIFDQLFNLIKAPTNKIKKYSKKRAPLTLVGLEGGKKKKHTRKQK
jgi:hypothetical protein